MDNPRFVDRAGGYFYAMQKMNGSYQVGSGRVVTVTHDNPFIDDIVTQSAPKIKEQYYETFFMDADGSYYMVPLSAAINGTEETAYSVGEPRKRRAPTGAGSSAASNGAQNGRSSFLRQPDPGAFGLSIGHTEDIGTWGTVPTDENGLLSGDIVSQLTQEVKQEWAAFREYVRRKKSRRTFTAHAGDSPKSVFLRDVSVRKPCYADISCRKGL